MDFKELAEHRYSVRKFTSQPVEKEKLDYVLATARLAPTAANKQPQRILVIEDKEALAKLADCTAYHFNAPLALLVCFDQNVVWRRTKYDGHNSGEIDASIVGTHIILAAASIGLGATWVMSFDPEAIRKAYQIPGHIVPVALFPLGYPDPLAKPNSLHFLRQPIEELTYYNEFR